MAIEKTSALFDAARRAAARFFEGSKRAYEPEHDGDWDAKAWAEDLRHLELTDTQIEIYWPCYRDALRVGTERLAREADARVPRVTVEGDDGALVTLRLPDAVAAKVVTEERAAALAALYERDSIAFLFKSQESYGGPVGHLPGAVSREERAYHLAVDEARLEAADGAELGEPPYVERLFWRNLPLSNVAEMREATASERVALLRELRETGVLRDGWLVATPGEIDTCIETKTLYLLRKTKEELAQIEWVGFDREVGS